MKITVTDQLSDCAAKLAGYLISENGLNIALKLKGSDPITRLDHKVLYNIYKKKGKYAFNKVLVVVTAGGIRKWNRKFYDIQDGDTFITSEGEARQYCNEHQPFIIEDGESCDTFTIITTQYDKFGQASKMSLKSFSTYDEADAYYEKQKSRLSENLGIGGECDDRTCIKSHWWTKNGENLIISLCNSTMTHRADE